MLTVGPGELFVYHSGNLCLQVQSYDFPVICKVDGMTAHFWMRALFKVGV